MEEYKKKQSDGEKNEKEIIFSQAIKAGKRIYYLDVKRSRKNELFLAITESKKVIVGDGDESQVNFEKHKIFLYKEDMDRFLKAMQHAINFIHEQQPSLPEQEEEATADEERPQSCNNEYATEGNTEDKIEAEESASSLGGELKFDIDF